MTNVDIIGVPAKIASGSDSRASTPWRTDANAPIILIERRPLTRQCISRWLQDGSPGLQVVCLASPRDLLDSPRSFGQPQLIMFSIGAAPVSDPDVLAKLTMLTRHMSRSAIVLLADRDEVDDIVEAIGHGVRGYIPPSLDPAEAAAALRCVAAGGIFVPASAMIKLAHDRQHRLANPAREESRPSQNLTPREAEVLLRLRQGKPNKIIAHELAISESTVKVFVRRILAKLHATNRTEVACLGLRPS